jgi:hypothetical protein
MRVFTCIDHAGHYSIGVASVVVARNEEQAVALLVSALGKMAYRSFTLQELDLSAPAAHVLADGNY